MMSLNIGRSAEEFLKFHSAGNASAGITKFVAPKAAARAGISTGGVPAPVVQKFVTLPTRDILETITGRIMRNHGADGIYNVCDTMTGQPHWTHELIDSSQKCAQVLTDRFPHLAKANDDAKEFFSKFDKEKKNLSQRQIMGKINHWVKKQEAYIGKEIAVPTIESNIRDKSPVETLFSMLQH